MSVLNSANLSSKLFVTIAFLNNVIYVILEEIFTRNVQIIKGVAQILPEIVEKLLMGCCLK